MNKTPSKMLTIAFATDGNRYFIGLSVDQTGGRLNRRTDQFYGQNGFAEFRNLGTLGDFNRRAWSLTILAAATNDYSHASISASTGRLRGGGTAA